MKRPSDQLFAKTPSQMRESKCKCEIEKIDEREEREEFEKYLPQVPNPQPTCVSPIGPILAASPRLPLPHIYQLQWVSVCGKLKEKVFENNKLSNLKH
jgi:hypothetical protein